MKFHLGFICISFLSFLLFLVGLYTFATNYESNRCNMTYMYDFPNLVRVSLPNDISRTYMKYGLYAYGEGKSTQKVRDMRFTGIPVLFIPGNRGSPKQVRSLASVSLSKSMQSGFRVVFDYFAVDVNEDFSGLYGGFLDEQAAFVNICIKRILSLYKHETNQFGGKKPKSIILIGHSMGGIIAKGLFLVPDFDPESVKVIITLATPHYPALLTDNFISLYYESVNKFWDNFNTSENNMNLISIGGGPRDLLVRSDLALTPHADISVVTPVIPSVWMAVDHLSILWCKELVLTLVRILFDLVDLTSRQITDSAQLRTSIFDYHLLNRSAGKSYHNSFVPYEEFPVEDYRSTWIIMNETKFTWTKSEGVINLSSFVLISLATSSDTLAVQAINHKTKDWLYVCSSSHTISNNGKKCKLGKNISDQGRIAPAIGSVRRKTALINLTQLRRDRYTYIVIRTLPTRESVQIHFDLFKKRDRSLPGSSYYFFRNVLMPQTENNSIYYSVELPDISKYWHNYEVHVTARSCPESVIGVASARVPWNNEGSTTLLRGTGSSIDVSLLSPKPPKSTESVAVELSLNPKCSYTISIERSILSTIGSVVGRFGVCLLAHITVCLLLTLAYQVKCLGETSTCPLLHFVMPVTAKPYFIIQASALTGTIAQSLAGMFSFLPDTDIKNQAGFIEVVIIPVFLHLTSFCITYLFATIVLTSVALQGQAFNGLFLRFINKFFFGLTWLSEYIMNGVSKVPIVVCAFMITVASSACGGLALSIGLFFYFFKLISLYEDFWEEIVYWPLKVLKWKLRQRRSSNPTEMPRFEIPPIKDISFHLTLMLLWSISAFATIPSVLVWAKTYKYSTHLNPDPSFYNAVIMSVCAGYLWQAETPKTGLIWSRHIGYAIVGSSILVMVYAQTSIYRISYILSGVFVLLTCHQLFGGFFSSDDDEPVVELIPIDDDEPSYQEADESESSPIKVEDGSQVKDPQDLSEPESNEDEDKSKLEPVITEKDSPSEGSSTSSFEHISEQEPI